MTALVHRLLVIFAVTALSGCASVIQPNLGPDPGVAKTYDATPTLPNAVAVGASMRERYVAKIEDQIAWERGIGVGLIGATAVAADLAIRSVGASAVLGLGLASAAAYTGSNWLFSKPQLMIYTAGANAVQCALDTVQPLQEPYENRGELRAKISETVTKIDEIERLLRPGQPASKIEAVARAMIDRANGLLPVARESLSVLDGATTGLRSSLSAIQTQVTNAYIANSPNMTALIESLGKSLPAMGSKIIGVSLPAIAVPDAKLANTSSPELDAKVKELDGLVARVAQITASVNVKPGDDRLKLCNVDLKQAGLSMKLAPAGDVSVQPGGAGTVVASGGVLPYRADWIGARPPSDQIGLKIESGQGFITVDAKAGAKADSYQLLILDAGQGREVVNVVIKGSSATASSPATQVLRNPPSIDPKVQRVQQELIAKGIKTVKVDGKDATISADGRMGNITIEAMRQFFKDQGTNVTDDQIPKGDQLLKEVSQLLGIK